MASSLAPILANDFLVYFEKNWLQNFSCDFRSHYYRWYIDDILVFLPHQNIYKSFKITVKINIKTECPFLMYI